MKLLPLLCVLVIAHELLGAEDLSNATLVVYNPTYPESKSLAEYYAARRGLPKDRLTALPCSNDEEIDRHDYDREIAEPLRQHFQEAQLWTVEQTGEPRVTANKIRYIVLIRGIPLKIRFQADYPGDNPMEEDLNRRQQGNEDLTGIGFSASSFNRFRPPACPWLAEPPCWHRCQNHNSGANFSPLTVSDHYFAFFACFCSISLRFLL